jgi:uncharacterized coiled-coil DUF342 family protein
MCEQKCTCGDPSASGVIHRETRPCYYPSENTILLATLAERDAEITSLRARVAELEAERDAARDDANMQSRERDACNQWLDMAIIATGKTCEKWSLAEAVAELRTERDAAAELKRLAGEVVKALENSSLYYGDAPYLCDEIKDLARHLSTTTETKSE